MKFEFIKNKINFFSCLLLIVMGGIIYSNTLNDEFQFDDNLHIVNETALNNLSVYSNPSTWLQINARPLSYFTLALNRSLNGDHVFVYHLFNLLVHLLASITVYFLSKLIITQKLRKDFVFKGKEEIVSLFIALLFLVHPIQTQAVSYIVQRMTSMATLFYLSSLYFYLRARLLQLDQGKKTHWIILYVVAIISAIAAILSKQIAVTLPLAILLAEFYFIRDKEGKRQNKYILIGAASMALIVMAIILGGFLPSETDTISRYHYFITELRVIVKYIQLLIIPISQNLDYDFRISQTIWGGDELLSLTVVSFLVVSIFTLYQKYPLISFGLAWFFITLSVESSIIPIQDVIFEHRLYLPMFGFAIIAVYTIFELFNRYKIKYLNQFIILIIVVLAFATYSRNKVWENKFTMWRDVVRKSPAKARPHINLGIAYIQLLKPDLAIRQFNIAKKLEPGKWDKYSYFNLGDAYLGMSQPALAVEQFDLAQKTDPENWEIYLKRGEAFLLLNRNDEALNDFNTSILLNNSSAQAFEARGRVSLKMQNFSEAIDDFSEAIRIDSTFIPAWFHRSNARLFAGDLNGALLDLDQVIVLDPDFAVAYSNRGQIKYNLNNHQAAISDLDKAIQIDPDFTGAYLSRAKVFLVLEDFDRAYNDIAKCMNLNPTDGNIYKLRGEYYLKTNQLELAYNDFITAKSLGVEVDEEVLASCKQKLNAIN